MQNLSVFVEVVQEIMIEKNLRAIDIAKGADIDKSLISDYLAGNSLPHLKNLLKIAEFLNVNIDYLLGRVTTKQNFHNNNTSTFFERLNLLRLENKISINKLLSECAITHPAYYKWKGGSLPYIPQIISLADYFCVSADYLLGLTDKR